MYYLRPGNLYKDFVIEPLMAEKSTTGRAATQYDTESRQLLRGVNREIQPERAPGDTPDRAARQAEGQRRRPTYFGKPGVLR